MLCVLKEVSIHTPTQGVTVLTYTVVGYCSFNPHTHAGCDDQERAVLNNNKVSIHTPTQGVTSDIDIISSALEFQSTHPRRV